MGPGTDSGCLMQKQRDKETQGQRIMGQQKLAGGGASWVPAAHDLTFLLLSFHVKVWFLCRGALRPTTFM